MWESKIEDMKFLENVATFGLIHYDLVGENLSMHICLMKYLQYGL